MIYVECADLLDAGIIMYVCMYVVPATYICYMSDDHAYNHYRII